MADYRVEGFVTDGVGGVPVTAAVVVFSRETFTVLGQGTSGWEDGAYSIMFADHPGPVFVVCFHTSYGEALSTPPYFSLVSPPTGEAEIHDNITPIAVLPM